LDIIGANIFKYDGNRQFLALGGEVSQGRGSRVRVVLNGVRAVFHQPHPQREVPKGKIKGVRDCLESAGISDGGDLRPEEEDN
jgi:hypothetical protein